MQTVWQLGITWLKRITKREVDPIESITVEVPLETLISKLPNWIIQDAASNRCLIIKEFNSMDHGDVIVALLPTQAIVFKNHDGALLDTEIFLTYLLRNRVPRVQTIVCYNEEYDCLHGSVTRPSARALRFMEITDAMGILVSSLSL